LDLKYREEVAALSAATGLRGLLDEHPQDILEVAFSHPAVIRDIDTPEDYRRFCRR
jgi:CTP:molybdopterin cytidylyltransferase MocA